LFEFRQHHLVAFKYGGEVESHDGVGGYVGCLVLEAPVHVDVVVHDPHGVTETLKAIEFLPFRGLRLVNFKLNVLSHVVSAATQHKHKGAHEEGRVLVSCEGFLRARLVRSLHPIPTTVSVTSETPSVL
jgi:hypothetical protein